MRSSSENDTCHLHDLHDLDALLVQPNDLLAALVKLLQRLLSCVFFFHQTAAAAQGMHRSFRE